MRTKAAILVEQKRPLEIAEIEVPALVRGQVLVKIHASGICGAQLGEIDGVKGPDKYLPHLLGHEAGGIVEAVGPGVTHAKEGDHVVLHWKPGAGMEAATPEYRWGNRTVHAGRVTTFQERTVVSENRVTVIPKNTDLELAALFGCCVTTGFGVVQKDAKVKAGESVLVIGVGGVGLAEVIAARLEGAGRILAADLYDSKLSLAKEYGATHLINSGQTGLSQQVRKILGDAGADVVLENTGNPKIIEEGFELCGPKGRMILVGVPPIGQKASIYTLPLHFGKVLTGSHGGQTEPQTDIPRYLKWQNEGKIDLSRFISTRVPLDKINDAILEMRQGARLRPIVVMAS